MFDYIVADTHFGHENILKYEPSRLEEAKRHNYHDFDNFMLDRWNNTLYQDSTILHLGDVAFGKEYKRIESLKGNVTLLVGNHDTDKHISFYRDSGWSIIDNIVLDLEDSDRYMLSIQNSFSPKQLSNRLLCALVKDIGENRVFFSHFPLFDDNPYDEKYKEITEVLEVLYLETNSTINIHGHTHSKVAKESFCKSACLERVGYEMRGIDYFLDKL